MIDKEILNKLEGNVTLYTRSIGALYNIINLLNDSNETLESFFEKFVGIRDETLFFRRERRLKEGDPLPSTKPEDFNKLLRYSKFVCLEAITNFRLLDEQIYALFPHISRACFDRVNNLKAPGILIKRDYALMQFLAERISVPLDPDSVDSHTPKALKMTSVYNPLTHIYEEKMVPVIPREYTKLYNTLRAFLGQKFDKDNRSSFLPEQLKKAKKHKQQSNQRLKGQKSKKVESLVQSSIKVTSNVDTLNVLEETQISQPVAYIEQNLTELPKVPVLPRIKSIPSKSPKPIIPQGGWSKEDQTRSIEAKLKNSQEFIPTEKDSQQQTKFKHETPFILSKGQYITLQEILSQDTLAYTMTFNRVKDLLEAIGIKVERNGGSHAHIHTPGHNIKTLVDIHYGWTDKYGPGTIKNLRTLMQNLGLDNPESVMQE